MAGVCRPPGAGSHAAGAATGPKMTNSPLPPKVQSLFVDAPTPSRIIENGTVEVTFVPVYLFRVPLHIAAP